MGFFRCDVLSEDSNKDIQVFFLFFFFKLERNLDCISVPLIILSSSEIKGLGLKRNQSWAKHSKVGPPSS